MNKYIDKSRMQEPTAANYADDEINLIEYWNILLERRWLIVAVCFLSVGVAVAAALLMQEKFRADTLLLPVKEEAGGGLSSIAGQLGGLAALAGINMGGGGGNTEEALAVLNSRKFINRFIEENKLLPVIFWKKWDDVNKTWKVSGEDIPTDWDAYKVFTSDILSVSEDKKTGSVTISVEWIDAELASKWANELVNRLNSKLKQDAIAEAQRSINYLKQELEHTSVVEMRTVIFNLIEAQTKNIMLANVRDEFAFKVVDPAVAPEERSKPKRKLMVVLGAILGLMIGVFLAFVLSFIDKQKALASKG